MLALGHLVQRFFLFKKSCTGQQLSCSSFLMSLEVTLPVRAGDEALHKIIISTAAQGMLFLVEANLGRDKTRNNL